MRNVTAGLFSSVDGVVEDPFLWQFDSFDEELGAGMNEMMGRIDTGLLDSLMLIVHPVVAGSGRRLFNDGDPLTRLELQSSQQTSKGNMILSYGLRGS